MKDWDEMTGRPERHKPRIVEFVESFEKKYKDDFPPELLTNTACMGVALFLFGPLENEDVSFYSAMIRKRVDDYRVTIH